MLRLIFYDNNGTKKNKLLKMKDDETDKLPRVISDKKRDKVPDRLTYTKIFLVDGLVGGPIDILELGPFRPRAGWSRIRSALVRIPDDGKQNR